MRLASVSFFWFVAQEKLPHEPVHLLHGGSGLHQRAPIRPVEKLLDREQRIAYLVPHLIEKLLL